MIVFKTFLKVLNHYKGMVILFTVILIFFAGFQLETNETGQQFVISQPKICIVNEDVEEGLTKDLIRYMNQNSKVIDIENSEDARNDALFYRDVSYIIYIPAHYKEDFLNGKNPQISIKSTKDYSASLAQLLLEKYIRQANIYLNIVHSEEELVHKINESLSQLVDIELTSKLNVDDLNKAISYYNFANYCILAGCIYVICMSLSSFRKKEVSKRTIISSMPYSIYNRKLLLSTSLFAFLLWLFYVILSMVLIGSIMWSMHGLFLIINSFLFTVCALTIAFMLNNLVQNKNAISGIVNVIALGSSFLCGAFVPMEWLPSFVIQLAHILPSYWYIKTNELLKNIEVFRLSSLFPILMNMIILVIFCVIFIVCSNLLVNQKRKIN